MNMLLKIKDDILQAIDLAYTIDCSNVVNPYEKADTMEQIKNIIKTYDLSNILKKEFYNIDV